MMNSDVYLSVNSFHLELLQPLVKWKILSIKELFEDSTYGGTYKGFHKVIRRLENKKLLGSFKDVWTKTKRIYLTQEGNTLVNPNQWRSDAYNGNALFHDSRASLYLRYLIKELNVTEAGLDQERMRNLRVHEMPSARPDAEFHFEDTKGLEHKFLLEIELTQKSKDRVLEKFANYQEGIQDYKLLFVVPTEHLAVTYRNMLHSLKENKSKHRFYFVVEPGLVKGNFSLERSYLVGTQEKISLQNHFMAMGARRRGDYKEILGGLWRKAIDGIC
jgi:hypothetical protein